MQKLTLADLCSPRVRTIIAKQIVIKTIVEPSTVRIPQSDKPISEIFVDPPIIVIDESTNTPVTFDCWIRAVLSKNPHYIYLFKTKSSWSNFNPQYWFLDTKHNVKLVLSKSEIKDKIKLPK